MWNYNNQKIWNIGLCYQLCILHSCVSGRSLQMIDARCAVRSSVSRPQSKSPPVTTNSQSSPRNAPYPYILIYTYFVQYIVESQLGGLCTSLQYCYRFRCESLPARTFQHGEIPLIGTSVSRAFLSPVCYQIRFQDRGRITK